VATVGGGASIPLITARLSERLRVPVHTAPQPAFSAAVGAAVLGQQQAAAGVATAASPLVENPTEAVETARVEGDRALAWSQDADAAAEPVPYTGPDMTGEYGREPTKLSDADSGRIAAAPTSLPWYKRTALVLSVVGAAAAVLVAVVLALTLGHTKTNPANTTPNEPGPPQTSQTVTITGPDDSTTVTVIPPPPPPSTTPTSQPPTTTPAPTTTSAQPTTTTQATTTAPTTTTRERPQPPTRPQPTFRP
jgi:hypothetical protein